MSELQLKRRAHLLRRRFGLPPRAEVAATVSRPELVEEEMRHLISAQMGARKMGLG